MSAPQPFEKVLTEHGPTVLRVCRALLNATDADDAWSETFLAALRAYPDLPPTANVEAWLVTIAHRKAIDVLRGQGRNPLPVSDLAAMPSPLALGDARDPDLWSAVGELSSKQRQALTYHYLGGLAFADVARIVGGTADAARRAAADGIKNLREKYSKEMERSES